MLLLEIALTIWACIKYNKAGKSWATGLIPIVSAMVIGFFMGYAGETSGLLIIDIAAVVVLIWMIATTKPAPK